MSINKYIQSRNYHCNQDIEQLHQSKHVPMPLCNQALYYSQETINPVSIPMVLPFPEYNTNGIIQYLSFLVWCLSLGIMHVRVKFSISLFHSLANNSRALCQGYSKVCSGNNGQAQTLPTGHRSLLRGRNCDSGQQSQTQPPKVKNEHTDEGINSQGWGDIKAKSYQTSLVVQWLRLCFPVQGVQVRSLVRKLRSHTPCGQNTKNIKQKQYHNKFSKDF